MNTDRIKEIAFLRKVEHKHLHGRDDSNPYYDFLYHMSKEINAKVIVELGTDKGNSACFLAHGSPNAKVITIGLPINEFAKETCSHFKNIEVMFENTNDLSVPEKLLSKYREIDLLFIDTEHSFNQAWGEYINYGKLVRKGGIILYDDIDLKDDMKEFWTKLPEPKISLPHLHWTGFGASIKEN